MKKEIIAIVVSVILLIGLLATFGIRSGNTDVKFEEAAGKNLPREIEAEILPEYRELERALACRAGDGVYVVVTRGEKPTSGYEVAIEKMELEKKDGKTKLIVYANFADPVQPENEAQIVSYPAAAAKTELKGLPDTIELRAEYVK